MKTHTKTMNSAHLLPPHYQVRKHTMYDGCQAYSMDVLTCSSDMHVERIYIRLQYRDD